METHEKLQDLRQRVLRNEEVTADEYKEILDDIRGDRKTAGVKVAKSSTSKVKEIDPDDLF